MAAGSSVCRTVVNGVEAPREKPGEEKNQDGLGDLRGLEGEAAEEDPAMGVLGVAKEEDDDEQDGGDGERGEDEARGFVDVVVDRHEDNHDDEAGDGPGSLAREQGVGVVEVLLRHDGRGGEDHGEAHDHEGEGGEEDPLVDADALGQFRVLRDRQTGELASLPHGHKVNRGPLRAAQDDNQERVLLRG